jgi:hypothetical protein
MKRVVLAILRLLLQLLMFALTGTWLRFEALEPAPAAPPRPQTRTKQKKPRPIARPVREGRRPAAPAQEADQTSLEVLLGGREGGVSMPRKRAGVRAVEGDRPTVGGVLRSAAGLRDAIVLDAALGTRRTRR